MKNGLILTVASWAAVLSMMAVICWHLAGAFAPAYPEPTERFTDTAFKALQYEASQNAYDKAKAEEFIRSLADGNLR